MRVVVLGPAALGLLHIRGPLLRAMVAAGHEVLALSADDDPEVRAGLAAMGVEHRAAPIARTGLNPVRDAWSVVWLARTLHAFRTDVILANSAKAVVYGLIGARLAGTPVRAAMITGAGSALMGGETLGRRAIAGVVRTLYWVGLRQAGSILFQNVDDERLFRSHGLVGGRSHIVQIPGSGVDLDAYPMTPLPDGPITFLLVARLLRDKGLDEYVAAARLVRARRPDARCQLLGPLDSNPSAVSAEELDRWQAEGVIEYLGATRDVRPAIACAHVCVLPSYREGMPRAVLESMAMGRPVITTDVPGCRETVVDGENGFLVPVRDAGALADAMLRMASEPERLPRMGERSRVLAETRFDVDAVNRVILRELGLLRPARPL